MVNIKLTPFALFIMLLFVLVLSVVLSKWLPLNLIEEGFISFYKTTGSNNTLIIPQYSNSRHVLKLYDSVFMDINNGNIIELDGSQYSVEDDLDISGGTITIINIIPRDGETINAIPTAILKGIIVPMNNSSLLGTSMSSSYTSWLYPNAISYNSSSQAYQVLYMPWNVDTYVHVIDIVNHKSVVTSQAATGYQNTYSYDSDTHVGINVPALPSGQYTDKSTTINTFITEPYYDSSSNKNLYVLSDYVMFDKSNGYLIIQTGTGDSRVLKVYSGIPADNGIAVLKGTGTGSNKFTPTDKTIAKDRLYRPFMVADTDGKNTVLYMQKNTKTIIALISQDSKNSSLYTLRNVVRFDSNVLGGVDRSNSYDTTGDIGGGGDGVTGEDDTGDDDTSEGGCDDNSEHDRDNAPSLDSIISDYYKKYWYSSKNASSVNQYSDDFLLKTQMIPPICPACPANCGSSGIGGVVDGVGQAVGGIAGGVGTAVGGIAGGVGDVAEGAGGVAGGALLGTGALAGGALMGAGALAGGVAQGVGSAIGGLGQGSQGYNSQAQGSQGYNSLSQGYGGQSPWNPTNVQNISSQGQGQGQDPARVGYYNGSNGQPQNVSTGNTYGSYIDKYSYNGALTSKGGDPMPVTSDFSKFGR